MQAPLHFAVVKGQVPMMKLLLTAKAEPDLRDNDGRTALMVAAEHGQAEAARTLIQAKAEVNACDRRGRTAVRCPVSRIDLHQNSWWSVLVLSSLGAPTQI